MPSGDSVQPIDLPALILGCGGDRGLAMEVLRVFLQQVPAQRADLERAVTANDLPLQKRAAHKLKGSLAAIYAANAVAEAERLERAASIQPAATLFHLLTTVIETAEALVVNG